jgi:DNA polymerase I
MNLKNRERFVIFDSNAVIHRAYHALPPLATKAGQKVNAVYGFLLVFLKAIADFSPAFIAATFDLPAPTFRHKKYREYKAKRPKAPEDLYSQIPIIKKVLSDFGVKIFEKEGYEADDIIATLAEKSGQGESEKAQVVIISGDLDSLQLINENIGVYFLRRGVKDTVLYDEKAVSEKLGGLIPEQILDYKALRGDPSDNIPGVDGIGEKTAIDLLLQFHSLDNIFSEIEKKSAKAGEIKPKLKESLLKNKNQAFFSRELVLLEKNVPVDFVLKECRWQGYDKEKIKKTLTELEFYSLVKRIESFGQKVAAPAIGKQAKLL